MASLGSNDDKDLLTIPVLQEKVLRGAAIYGPNASGKTTVLRALQFVASAVRNSHRLWEPDKPIPIQTFYGSPTDSVSEFEVDFIVSGVRYQYEFSLTSQLIVNEQLLAFPNGKKQTWFKRSGGRPITFGRHLPGENKTIAGLTRKNSLFLSAAAQNNHEALSPVYHWFARRLSFVIGERSGLTKRTAQMCLRDERRSILAKLLTKADLGITDIKVSADKPDNETQEKSKRVWEAIASIYELKEPPPAPDVLLTSVQLLHRIGESVAPFELSQESNGTVAYLSLLGPITSALENGSVILIDEFDKSLHPHVGGHILEMFNRSPSNPRGAQLIFNTHDVSLLQSDLLRRDQVWFTEKDRNGESRLYPLTDFQPRKEENFRNGYMLGRYGAIPFIQSEPSFEAFNNDAEVR